MVSSNGFLNFDQLQNIFQIKQPDNFSSITDTNHLGGTLNRSSNRPSSGRNCMVWVATKWGRRKSPAVLDQPTTGIIHRRASGLHEVSGYVPCINTR